MQISGVIVATACPGCSTSTNDRCSVVNRAIAARYDKTARNLLAALCVGLTITHCA